MDDIGQVLGETAVPPAGEPQPVPADGHERPPRDGGAPGNGHDASVVSGGNGHVHPARHDGQAPAAHQDGQAPAVHRDGQAEPHRRERRIRLFEAALAQVIVETHDTVTLVLEIDEPTEYRAGQFLTVDPHQFGGLRQVIAYLEDAKKKKEPPRAYSMASAPHEPHVAFTVKEETFAPGETKYPPILSPFLVRCLSPGMRVEVTGFTGPYTLPPDIESRTDHLVHLVAGSGVVPNFSILKDALAHHPGLRHTFIYSNKTWNDVIFRQDLAELERQYPDRLRVVHTLTRDAQVAVSDAVRRGRVDAKLLRELIPDPKECLVYACGSANGPHERARARERGEEPKPKFLEAVLAALDEIGGPKDRVKRESW